MPGLQLYLDNHKNNSSISNSDSHNNNNNNNYYYYYRMSAITRGQAELDLSVR